MRRLRLIICLAMVVLASLAGTAHAKDVPHCGQPRDAVDSVFRWQLGDQQSLKQAAKCLERKGRTQKQLEESARRIKAVYDSAGAFVLMDKISDKASWTDPDSHKAQVVPHADLPDITVEKRGDHWVWTRESLDLIDARYAATLQGLDRIIEKIPGPLHGTVGGVAGWQYLAIVLLFAAGFIVRKVLKAVVASRVRQVGEKLNQNWATAIVDIVASPGATLAVAVILRVGYPQLRLPIGAAAALAVAVRVLITLSIVWAIYGAVDLVGVKLAERAERTDSKLDDQLVPLIRKALKVVVFIAGTLVVLQNMNIDVTTLLTGVSIGSLAFALAAKDTIANLFGSITIFIDRPFQIGDWINVSGVDGTVEEVGFRSTRIRTFYDSVVVLPNAKIADAKIDNYGRRKLRRCMVTLGLTYDTTPEQMQAFVEGVRAIIRANPLTHKKSYEVFMSGFGDSALEVLVFFFFKCDTWHDELRGRHNIYLEFMRLAGDLGVSFAFPTQSLHIESAAAPTARAQAKPPTPARMREIVHGYGPDGEISRPDGPTITRNGYVAGTSLRRGDDASDPGDEEEPELHDGDGDG